MPADKKEFSLAPALSLFATSTYAWVYPTSDIWENWGADKKPTLWFASCAYMRAENIGWMPRFLAQMAIMRPIDAQTQVNGIKEIFKGGVANTSRPVTSRMLV